MCDSTTARTFKTETVKAIDVIAAVAQTNACVCGSKLTLPYKHHVTRKG